MSTVASLERYFNIRGISNDIVLVTIDYEIDEYYQDYLKYHPGFKREDIGCLFVEVGNAEILRIWVCGSSVPYSYSHIELAWSHTRIEKNRKRKIARRKTHTKDISKTEYRNIDTGIVDLVIWRDSKGNILNQYNPNDK